MFILNILVSCLLLANSVQCSVKKRFAVWGSWHTVERCTVTCGGQGFTRRERECSTGFRQDCLNVGGNYYNIDVCNEGPCVNGPKNWLEWTANTACSVSCDGGFQQSNRKCYTGRNADCEAQGGRSWKINVCNQKPCSPTPNHIGSLVDRQVLANWLEWIPTTACSASCDGGFQESSRECSTGRNRDCEAHGGRSWKIDVCNQKPCSPIITTTTISPKTTQTPPSWSEWQSVIACSTTCGPGFEERLRNCSSGKDDDCPGSYFETTVCNKRSCDVDGIWTQWSEWVTCSVTCGGGLSSRARACFYQDPARKGKPCSGVSAETHVCNTNVCPADGAWNEWSTWSQCSHTCAGGKRSRSRVCLYGPDFDHGLPCPGGTLELQECGLTECPVDGVWSIWYKWSQCTVTCGTGRAVRNRTCSFHTRYPDTPHGDDCDGEHAQTKDCNTQLCPVDARWSTWSAFSTCSQTCGGGRRTKARQCIYDEVAQIGLNCTGQSTVTEECSTNECPIDGIIQPWNSWTFCSTSCGGGVHTRTRDCFFPPNRPHGADCKEQLNETAPCNVQSCPTATTPPPPTTTLPTADGHWSNWTSWTMCTLTCGGGQQYRERQCTYPDHTLHGQYCPGPKNQTQECNSRNCPVDGIWTQWSAYSKCSVSCASGFQTRARQCQFDPRYDRGNSCPGNDTSTQLCDNGHCPVDGVFENWSTWNACPVTCGGGIQDRMRVCHFPPNVPHGLACLGISHENQTCGNSDCPVDGVLTEWSQWADCTLTCGGGYMIRNRTCYFPPYIPHGHDCVGNLNFAKACASHACPVDGVWNDWASWATCSLTCGGGSQQRTRRCHYDSPHHGTPCAGPDTETRDCSTDHCPIDGHWKTWNSWTSCSVTCSNGTKSRARECYFVPDEPKGNNCSGSANETFDCNLGLCPVDGHWSDWTPWSSCSVTCATGNITRSRTCSNPAPANGGHQCYGLGEEWDACNLPKCPISRLGQTFHQNGYNYTHKIYRVLYFTCALHSLSASTATSCGSSDCKLVRMDP
ncbi:hypothetical protein DPMN_005591 [Dreissena polymorpha]|uniref:Hemicentin-1 n=1 Tax=Dreissena polymorpha TaxID=45954 RepID=A0A9D4MTV3_DREPO|nr:hypothetical protein DPMN_005591 [Dreissena polymorpha]